MFLFGNGAFGSKWCGLWRDQTKFFDYIALRADGEWLSPDTFKSLKYDGVTAELKYGTKTPVTERICAAEGGAVVQLSAKRKCRFDLEVGVDIRGRGEDVRQEDYKVTKRKGVHASNSLGRLSVRAKKSEFTPAGVYGMHVPGVYAHEQGYDWDEGPQRKFVPGLLSVSGKKAEFRFAVDSGKVSTFSRESRSLRKRVEKHAEKCGWRLAASLGHFITRTGGKASFFAGFPYFNELWTRDFLWMAKPLMDRGFTEEVGEALGVIAGDQLKDGSIPNMVGQPGSNADSTPLWIIAHDELARRTGKYDRKRLDKALKFGRRQLHQGLVDHPANLTWMDTLERHGAVEIQSLWAEAFDRGDRVLGGGWGDLAAAVWESLETRYLKHEVFRDALDGPFKFSANSLVPVFFGQTSLGQRRRTLKRAREELVTPHGLRAASQKEAGQGYHERVWGLTTYWGMETLGAGVAEGYIKFMDSRTLYGMPETIAGGVPKGATHQLWSIAFLGGGQE